MNDLTLSFIHNFEFDRERFLAKLYKLEEEIELFFLCEASEIQDAFRFRAVRRSHFLAQFLINEKGIIKKEIIKQLLHEMEKEGSILYPGGTNDLEIDKYFLKVLTLLLDEPFLKLLYRFQLPLCHAKAESLIRESIGLEPTATLTEVHIRTAVLSALLCPLRQNVGSCFATAPAILVHEEQPERFLDDLYQLLTTGKLKRTFGGIEYVVPMSPSSGAGDLKKNIFSFSSPDRILFSPGLIYAFTKVGQIDPALPLEEKVKKLHALAFPYLEGRKQMTVEDLIKQLIPNETFCKRAFSYFKSFADHLLLKTWEFTLASFVDVKTEFSRWNLYISLGLNPEESGGLGELIYQHLSRKLEEKNQKIQQLQTEYEIAFEQVRSTERLLKHAGSETEARRLVAEHSSRYYHMQSCLELRDKNQSDAEQYAQFFSFLMKQYFEKFPSYFQEIYDAEMEGVVFDTLYDDIPAGFRLLYKHGRADPSVWSFVYTEEEYTRYLVDFFIAAEQQLRFEIEWEEGKEEISSLTTAIVQFIRSDEFLKSAFQRTAKSHFPGSKPWAYISGGTMSTLLKTYFKREGVLSEESRRVENPQDLLIFILDVLKSAPISSGQRVLMTSPTHAFSLLTGQPDFEKAIDERGFSYTWVRDQLLLPQQRFYDEIWLSSEDQNFLISKFFERIPIGYRTSISIFPQKLSVKEFRTFFLRQLGSNKLFFATELDSLLYEMLPLSRENENIERLLQEWNLEVPEKKDRIVGALELRNSALAVLISSFGTIFDHQDVYLKIMKRAQAFGLAPPPCLIVGDNNWSERESYFAFLVNPGTDELELWRVDRTGNYGKPMHLWQQWLNSQSKEPWTIYNRPKEYS